MDADFTEQSPNVAVSEGTKFLRRVDAGERMTKGVIDERVLYRVSPDGKTLVWTNFDSAGDSGHVVWDRIELPPR